MVKSVMFKATLEGNGIVNYDGTSESQRKYMSSAYNMEELTNSDTRVNENFLLAKHLFTSTGSKLITPKEGDPYMKEFYKGRLFISSNALRHYIFEEGMPNLCKNDRVNNEVIAKVMSHPAYLLRGWLETKAGASKEQKKASKAKGKTESNLIEKTEKEKENDTLKRGRIISLANAVQMEQDTNIPFLSVHSNMGKKDSNSLFSRETIGDVKYETKGFINLSNLMFLSMDDNFGDMAIHPDVVYTFAEYFNKHTGLTLDIEKQVGGFCRKNQAEKFPQIGILFTQEQVMYLLRYFFKNFATLKIDKSTGFVQMTSLEYKLISDPTKKSQLFSSEDAYESISTLEDIDNIDFKVYPYYEKVLEAKDVLK